MLKRAAEKKPKTTRRVRVSHRDASSFSRFAGRWTEDEAKAFDAATRRETDLEDWEPVSWIDFRRAVRGGSIDAKVARRLFRKNFMKLGEICRRENCSLEKARTINAALEGEISAALLKAGLPTKGSAYDSVSPRVHALRGLVRLPEDFDEREFKFKRRRFLNDR